MCGIIGIEGKNAKIFVRKGLQLMRYRGRDDYGTLQSGNISYGHVLHAVNSHVRQPLKDKGILTANCEIYNWKRLSEKYKLPAENDTELLLCLIEKLGISKALKEIDGPYAFSYDNGKELILARDIIGVKPLWYSDDPAFAFASEKKVLVKLGYQGIKELNPRNILVYSRKKRSVTLRRRAFFSKENMLSQTEEEIKLTLMGLVIFAVAKRIPNRRFGILFSGGIDSTMIALICKHLGLKPTLYTAALEEKGLKAAEDYIWAKEVAAYLKLPLKATLVRLNEVPAYAKEVMRIIEDRNTVKVGVALPYYLACREARKDKIKVLFSGLGSEEIFAGYQRHRNSDDVTKECRDGLMIMYKRDLYRDDSISMANTIELRHPFLDRRLIRYALRIPPEFKIRDQHLKFILRRIALAMGLPEKYAMRKKRAAQYGSNFDKAIAKLSKRESIKKSEYLKSL